MNSNSEKLVLDRTNFPMVWVDALNGYIHLLPVTKIQFEYYLWDAPNSGLDQSWYEQVTRENGRISPHETTKDNYWRLFMSAVTPPEAMSFVTWSDAQRNDARYSLPTAAEWQAAYQHFKSEREQQSIAAALDHPGLAPRCRATLLKLQDSLPATSLAERLLFRGGVMEWVNTSAVSGKGQNWGLFGEPSPKFVVVGSHPDNPKPHYPNNVNGRHKAYGFRLIRRKIA